MSEVVLAVFAHPDDEVLGCGGTLAKHVAAGTPVHARFLSTGVGSRGDHDGSGRLVEMRKAAGELGLASVDHASLPDQQMDTEAQLNVNRVVEGWLLALSGAGTRPTVIYTHSPHDLNHDHRIVHDAVMVATRPTVYGPSLVLGCEIAGTANGFAPVAWETLDAHHHERGYVALGAYKSERQIAPLPRSGWAWTAGRMAGGTKVGVWYAEGFEVLRWVR